MVVKINEHRRLYMPPSARASYDAVQDKKKRTAPRAITKAEDKQLDTTDRRKLTATNRDQLRNFATVAWMVRKHIDYVARFGFQARTDDEGLNRDLEAYITTNSRASLFDAGGRFNRQRFVNINECLRVLDGDVFALKLASGRLQAIEADRVEKPWDLPPAYAELKLTHGVVVSDLGRPARYCVCKRKDSRRLFDKMVWAHNVIPHGFFWRHDQVRGVSPLSTCVNTAQDVYEILDYTAIKAKLASLFGAAIVRKEPMGVGALAFEAPDQTRAEVDAGDTADTASQIATMKPGISQVFELADTEDVKIIESSHPPAQLVDFTYLELRIILLALDIPYTFFDSRASSYSARLGDNQQYMISARTKQDAVESWHNLWTHWRLNLAINRDRDIRLPRGQNLYDLKWTWTPTTPYPWTDTLKETKADVEQIHALLNSPQRVCKRRGLDYYEIVDEIAEAKRYAEERGLTMEAWIPDPGVAAPEDQKDTDNE